MERSQTPEAVALELVSRILGHDNQEQTADKDNMLSLYAECLRVVKGGEYRKTESSNASDKKAPADKSKLANATSSTKPTPEHDADNKQRAINEYNETDALIKAQAS